ncbi:hypothetical protein AB0D14_24075 [Streptomyces sp. NPDC048484]|uniref:hypothetical protein n=1 Tax=Streptomyces sp. NPDC048484 TaxID=3155146 RepID=UPI0034301670
MCTAVSDGVTVPRSDSQDHGILTHCHAHTPLRTYTLVPEAVPKAVPEAEAEVEVEVEVEVGGREK